MGRLAGSGNETGGELSRSPRRSRWVFLMLASVGLSPSPPLVWAAAAVVSRHAANNRAQALIVLPGGWDMVFSHQWPAIAGISPWIISGGTGASDASPCSCPRSPAHFA